MNPKGNSIRVCSSDQPIYQAGASGPAWRVTKGVVRLDRAANAGESGLASLAVAGDIIGCETLLMGAYTFTATALTCCELRSWPEEVPSAATLMESLVLAQRRAASLLALRSGQAVDRVLCLIRFLSSHTENGKSVVLPSRQNIADITCLRFETVTRAIKSLERSRCITPLRINGVHATRGFSLSVFDNSRADGKC